MPARSSIGISRRSLLVEWTSVERPLMKGIHTVTNRQMIAIMKSVKTESRVSRFEAIDVCTESYKVCTMVSIVPLIRKRCIVKRSCRS